ncbi:MAG: GntR family transcriptional regulator [Bacteroidales bacterium]
MKEARYRLIYRLLKERIQQGHYRVGDLLPSENELCRDFTITRTTARRALDELVKEGFIERTRGRRSVVTERRKALGLLSIQGFSEAAGEGVETEMLTPPGRVEWPRDLTFPVSEAELARPCIHFRRLRKIKGRTVMVASEWFADAGLDRFLQEDFVEGSFFRTLSRRHLIEITRSSQELHAMAADGEVARLLEVAEGAPVLRICIKFTTSHPLLNIYSRLYCNTESYPIGNQHFY